MNEYRIKGNWNEIKGKVKDQWGDLTDDQLKRIDGHTDRLVGAIQRNYGRTFDEARREVNEWRDAANC